MFGLHRITTVELSVLHRGKSGTYHTFKICIGNIGNGELSLQLILCTTINNDS